MKKPSSDHSVEEDLNLLRSSHHPDRSEHKVDRLFSKAHKKSPSLDEKVAHTVWDEPGISPELAGAKPADAITYKEWLKLGREGTSHGKSWVITCLVALVAGPWAILGAFWGSGGTLPSMLALVLIGPVVEEAMKVGAALLVVEKKPFLFRVPVQIAVCAIAGGFIFATIENLLYLKVYIPDPSPAIIEWRWSVCVALHMGCSCIAGLGLIRVWKDTWKHYHQPRLHLWFPYIIIAVAIHGTYNGLALLLELLHFQF